MKLKGNIGCAEQREAHRARLMRFAFAQHILLPAKTIPS